MRNVLILGASGTFGKALVHRLECENDCQLTLVSRHASSCFQESERCHVVDCDATKLEELEKVMIGCDVVYCAISGDDLPLAAENIVSAMKKLGLRHLILMGAVGIYNEIPADMDDEDNVKNNPDQVPNRKAVDIVENSDLDYTVLRPGYLRDGDKDDFTLTFKGEAAKGHIKETWQILEEYVDKGKIRSIGVSNFNPHHIDELLGYARIRPVVNQIEIEPYMTQPNVVGYTFRTGILVEAWGPLGQGVTGVLDDPAIREIAARHGKSAAQIVLRWHMQRGLVTIPRCDNDAYTDENIRIFDFELSPSEMEIISGLNRNRRAYEQNDPDNFPW